MYDRSVRKSWIFVLNKLLPALQNDLKCFPLVWHLTLFVISFYLSSFALFTFQSVNFRVCISVKTDQQWNSSQLNQCVCVSAYFDLSIGACSKQPGLCTVQGHGGDLCVTMATVELLDLLACVSLPADHRGGRVTADYLHTHTEKENETKRGYQSSARVWSVLCCETGRLHWCIL